MVVDVKGWAELVPGSTPALVVVRVAATADATSLGVEVTEDEEAVSLDGGEDDADVVADAGASATLVAVEVSLVDLCVCLCP